MIPIVIFYLYSLKSNKQKLGLLSPTIATGQQSVLERKAKKRMKEAEFRKASETKVVDEGPKLYIYEDYILEKYIVKVMDPFRIDLTFTS